MSISRLLERATRDISHASSMNLVLFMVDRGRIRRDFLQLAQRIDDTLDELLVRHSALSSITVDIDAYVA